MLMWISKKRWENLVNRLGELESIVAKLQYDTQVWTINPITPEYPSTSSCEGIRYSKQIILNSFRGENHILLKDIVTELVENSGYKIQKHIPSKKTVLVKKGSEKRKVFFVIEWVDENYKLKGYVRNRGDRDFLFTTNITDALKFDNKDIANQLLTMDTDKRLVVGEHMMMEE